jgi:hypothetical protein
MLKVVRVSGKPAATKLIGNRLEVQTQSGEQGDIRGRTQGSTQPALPLELHHAQGHNPRFDASGGALKPF